MRRALTFVTLSLLIALAGTALAGSPHKKCDHDVQNCLNVLASKIQSKPWLGVDMEKTDSGWLRVTAVVPDSPAAAAGFQPGDVVVALNGVLLNADKEELIKVKKSLAPGKVATYVVKRDGGKQKLSVTLGHVPATVMAEWIGEHMLKHHVRTAIASVD